MEEESDIATRVSKVQARLISACEQAGRDPATVQLVAVSKRKPPEAIRAAMDAGLWVFGENRVQEAATKINMLPGRISWHLVGHLQSNKAPLAARLFQLIHAVESESVLKGLEKGAANMGKVLPILLQVNVGGETSKFGVSPEELLPLLETVPTYPHLDVRGLMTLPPFTEKADDARPFFKQLRDLRDRAQAETDFDLSELSMGMSHDFEIAIQEGATMVRIGTDIFGARN